MPRREPSYAPYLRLDESTGVVTLVDPIGPDDDAEAVSLGDFDSPRIWRRCPAELRDDLDDLHAEWVRGLSESGGGRRELRRMYREGSLR